MTFRISDGAMSMRVLLVLLLLLVVASSAYAQSQFDMNQSACATADHAEKQLQSTVATIKQKFAKDTVFLAKFDVAQSAWRKFADAQLEAIYPAGQSQVEYGSVFPMCFCVDKAAIIRDRLKQLQAWVKVGPEGDVCYGSRTGF